MGRLRRRKGVGKEKGREKKERERKNWEDIGIIEMGGGREGDEKKDMRRRDRKGRKS